MNRARISPERAERLCMLLTAGAGAWLILIGAGWVIERLVALIGGAA